MRRVLMPAQALNGGGPVRCFGGFDVTVVARAQASQRLLIVRAGHRKRFAGIFVNVEGHFAEGFGAAQKFQFGGIGRAFIDDAQQGVNVFAGTVAFKIGAVT